MISSHEPPSFLASEETLDRFLTEFRGGSLPKKVFSHSAHVAMASCYSLTFDEPECLDVVRRDIRHFNESVGGQNTDDAGYHETLTVFWLRIVRRFLMERTRQMSRLQAVLTAVSEYAPQRDLFVPYYSFDVVKSREARRVWIPPDLLDL